MPRARHLNEPRTRSTPPLHDHPLPATQGPHVSDKPRHDYAPHWETRTNPDGTPQRVRLASCPPCGWIADTVVEGLEQRIDQYRVHKITTDHKTETT